MNQDIRALIGKALQDEPALRIDKHRVMASSRRRQRRRPAVLAGAAVLSVVAILTAAVVVNERLTVEPAPAPTSESPQLGVECQRPPVQAPPNLPTMANVNTSDAALVEAGRLTTAFQDFAFPAPPGFEVPPITICALGDGFWGAEVMLRSADRDVAVYVQVMPGGVDRAEQCRPHGTDGACRNEQTSDGAALRISWYQQPDPSVPLRATVSAWRPDGTTVHVTETGPEPGPRLLDDAALIAIATAPQLKVDWLARSKPTESRARELSEVIAAADVLPPGMQAVRAPATRVEAMEFDAHANRYELDADLVDGAGEGNLRIELVVPPSDMDSVESMGCTVEPVCEQITLPDGRDARVTRSSSPVQPSTELTLSTFTASGVLLHITSSNMSQRAINYGNGPWPSEPTRLEPPLDLDTLMRIAMLAGLDW